MRHIRRKRRYIVSDDEHNIITALIALRDKKAKTSSPTEIKIGDRVGPNEGHTFAPYTVTRIEEGKYYDNDDTYAALDSIILIKSC